MLTTAVIEALRDARRQLPRESWNALRTAVNSLPGAAKTGPAANVLAAVMNRDVAWALQQAVEGVPAATWSEVAAAMLSVETLAMDSATPLQVIWSGPLSRRFAPRRTDQVLYDLLATAQKRALVVTFSAYRIERLCRMLTEAFCRGVEVTLILETEAGSAGQLSHDARRAFEGCPLREWRVLHWPRASREVNDAGRPGKLHAKCAVIDDTVLGGSANLTDDAFNRNIEFGLAVSDSKLADSIIEHFRDLESTNVLERVRLT